MKERTNRRGSLVSKFIMALGLAAVMGDNNSSGVNYAGMGAKYGSPMFTPKRTKFKGYMRDKSYKAKRG